MGTGPRQSTAIGAQPSGCRGRVYPAASKFFGGAPAKGALLQPEAVTIQLQVRVPPHPTLSPRRGNHSSTLWDGSLNGDAFRAWPTAHPLPWGEGRVRGNGLTDCIVTASGCRSVKDQAGVGLFRCPEWVLCFCSLKAALLARLSGIDGGCCPPHTVMTRTHLWAHNGNKPGAKPTRRRRAR